MRKHPLQEFISRLEAIGELKRIDIPVSTCLEITEVADRMIKTGGPALLFENTGTPFPLLINAFGSDRRLAAAFGAAHFDQVVFDLERSFSVLEKAQKEGLVRKIPVIPEVLRLSRRMPKKHRGRGACQEVVMDRPDLHRLPVLTCWPADGGPFITLPAVHTIDPLTGQPNTGMYRMQVYDEVTTGMHWHLHKDGAAHFRRYQELGRRMPVTVTLGGDPVLIYASTAPLPPFIDENLFAGIIRKKGVRLVKSLTNDIWIPDESDIVIEGYVDPSESLRREGPFGDHTGFYSLADDYPVFHVTAITHRRGAVYPATIVGIPPQEDLWLGKATGKIFLMPIRKTMVPELESMEMPAEGVFHNIVLTSVRSAFPGTPQKVAGALWGAGQMMFNKILVIFNREVNLKDTAEMFMTLSSNVDPASDIFFQTGPLDVLDHASRSFAFGSKMAIDATRQRNLHVAEPLPEIVRHQITAIKGVFHLSDQPVLKGLPLLLIFVAKNTGIPVKTIHNDVAPFAAAAGMRFICYLDMEAAGFTLSDCVWLMAGNLDPERDVIMIGEAGRGVVAGLDGTRKGKVPDGFTRDWPNPVVMNKDTIDLVDRRWSEYKLGNNPGSPSLRYSLYMQGDDAVSENPDQVAGK
jgi:4-hydroxy-3-polyprenylbenzoate decarboxylase